MMYWILCLVLCVSTFTLPCLSECAKPLTLIQDWGHEDRISGFFDVYGTGCKNDYCRMVGEEPHMHFSCALATSSPPSEYSDPSNSFVQQLEQRIHDELIEPTEWELFTSHQEMKLFQSILD